MFSKSTNYQSLKQKIRCRFTKYYLHQNILPALISCVFIPVLQLISYLVCTNIQYVLYINGYHSFSVALPIDKTIPYLPQFWIIYFIVSELFWISSFLIIYFLLDERQYYTYCWFCIICIVTISIVWICFPSYDYQQQIDANNMRIQSFCTFPSGHCFTLTASLFAVFNKIKGKRYSKWIARAYFPAMTALCLSSIFLTKQHYLLDLPITVSIMLCCYVISTKFINCNKFLNDFFIKLVNCFWPFSSNN